MTARHALSGGEAHDIGRYLTRTRHIPVVLEVDEAETVHLYPQRQVSTAEEVVVLTVVLAKTDSRVAWHAAVA